MCSPYRDLPHSADCHRSSVRICPEGYALLFCEDFQAPKRSARVEILVDSFLFLYVIFPILFLFLGSPDKGRILYRGRVRGRMRLSLASCVPTRYPARMCSIAAFYLVVGIFCECAKLLIMFSVSATGRDAFLELIGLPNRWESTALSRRLWMCFFFCRSQENNRLPKLPNQLVRFV